MICLQNRIKASLQAPQLYFQGMQLPPSCRFLPFLFTEVISFTLEQSQFFPQEGQFIRFSVHCKGVPLVLLYQILSAYSNTQAFFCFENSLKRLNGVLEIRYFFSLRHPFQIILHFAPLQLVFNFLQFLLFLPELTHKLGSFQNILVLLFPEQLYLFFQTSHSPQRLPNYSLLLLNVIAQGLFFFSQSADFPQDIFLRRMSSPEFTRFILLLSLQNFLLCIFSLLHYLLYFLVLLLKCDILVLNTLTVNFLLMEPLLNEFHFHKNIYIPALSR